MTRIRAQTTSIQEVSNREFPYSGLLTPFIAPSGLYLIMEVFRDFSPSGDPMPVEISMDVQGLLVLN
jgi:hypothetical protein